jgi:putative endonuclease
LNLLAPLYRFADLVRFRRHGNVGRCGEDLAHRFLRCAGFTVVARNWRPPQGGGEIDLVAWDGETLVFVEVKTRVSGERNAAVRDIDAEKMRVLRRAARDYMRRAGAEGKETRFDVIAIEGGKLDHARDAFSFA